jgi:hypothetical protein
VQVTIEVSGIRRQIFAWRKLLRIDKDTRHHNIGMGSGSPHEADVTLMQKAHGGYESQGLISKTQTGSEGTNLIYGMQNFEV